MKMRKSVLLIALCLTVSAHATTWVDNFNGTEPNQTVWTFINPLGDASVTTSGGIMSIAVPAGANHDPSIPNTAPRIMANVQDVNFTIETKFNSDPNYAYQIQGLLVQQDSDNFIRFDIFSDGSNMKLYAESFAGGSGNTELNTTISKGTSYYLRIDRQADQWTLDYSYDGNDWSSGTSFALTMAVSSAGVHAGNFGSGSDAPAFTAMADYFSSTIAPLARDPNEFGLIVNAGGGGTVTKDPDKTSYNAGDQVTLTAIPNGGAEFLGWTGAVSDSNNPVVLTVTGNHVVTAVFDSNSNINVWYGQHQIFSQQGTPQRWINILGDVTNPTQIKSLTYSLNGGSQLPLSMGPPNPRLTGEGDFNIEIACADLLPAPAQNNIEITATDLNDNITTASVSCEYFKTNSWPLPYDVNWSTVTDISDVAQAVDGQWVVDQNGISTVVEGYDRAFAVGDMNNWRDYEVTVPITVHQSYHVPGQSGNQPAVGLVLHWTGHYQDTNDQPATVYTPIGASVLFKWSDESSGQYIFYNHDFNIIGEANSPGTLQPEVTYMFKMRVETIPSEGILYSFKVWENGQSEPNAWLLQREEDLTNPQNGSILLLAHHVDATFGNITVTNTGPLRTIDGRVLDANEQPVSGVTINGLPGNPVTDGNGVYSAAVSDGWTWTVTPTKEGYTFDPPYRSYTNVTADYNSQDYTGTQHTFTISGNAGIGGVTMSGLPGNPVADSNGLYSAVAPYGWSGTATPTKTGYTFTPTSRSYTNVTADSNSQNYTAAQITFTISGNAGIGGVTMSGLPGNPVADSNGLYSAVVPYGWSGTATPTKTGYTFTPTSRSYTNVTADSNSQNYTAAQITFTISGNAGIGGVTMSGLPGNPVADSNGLYSAVAPYGWSGTATPTKTGYTFTPTNRSYTNVIANSAAQNYTADADEQSLPITITKFTIKAGKTRAALADSFSIAGTFGATLQDITGSTAIYIRLSNASEMIFEGVIPYDSAKLKSGKYSYTRHKGEVGNINSAGFDLNKKTFRIAAKGLDLTGLSCPVTVELEWGSYADTVDANEAIVNGKKPIPMPLLNSYADALRVDKATVHTSTKANRDSLTIKGAIAFASAAEDLTQHSLTLHWGTQDFNVPAGGFVASTNRRYAYTSPKGTIIEIKKVRFDLEKCTFTFSVKNAAITSRTGTVECGITCGTFDEAVTYTLP